MRARVASLAAGVLFAVGLALSGMTQPEKVTGFLDVTGRWDPSLALVMVGAIGVHLTLSRLIERRGRPLLDTRFHFTKLKAIDPALVGGAALFGLGWGIAGYCPGPALVSLGGGAPSALLFFAAMIGGQLLFTATRRVTSPVSPPAAQSVDAAETASGSAS